MQRTRRPEVVVKSTKLRWQKIGGGSLRWNGRIIKPQEIFYADKEELPVSFLDTLVCLESEEVQEAAAITSKITIIPEASYELKKADKGKNLWNVVNSEGKTLNESPLSKESAEELLIALTD